MRKAYVLLVLVVMCAVLCGAAQAEADLSQVRVTLDDRVQGNSNVLVPTLSGHPDPIIQGRINDQIAAKLNIADAMVSLERAKTWGDEGAGIHMQGTVYQVDHVLSIAVSAWGELPGGQFGQQYTTFNYDLQTGMPIVMGDLFADANQASQAMEEMLSAAFDHSPLNPYLEYREILPMPRDTFSLSANGLTVYYPNTQYALLTGEGGTYAFLYYQLEPYLKQDSPLVQCLLASRPKADHPAQQIRDDAQAGRLPGVAAQLGDDLAGCIQRYQLLTEPDYTVSSMLYQFTAPEMQYVALEGTLYPEDEDHPRQVEAIRAARIDLYGLRPGVSTADDLVAALGEPEETVALGAAEASDLLLPPGTLCQYRAGEHMLAFHLDESGVLTQVILRKN